MCSGRSGHDLIKRSHGSGQDTAVSASECSGAKVCLRTGTLQHSYYYHSLHQARLLLAGGVSTRQQPHTLSTGNVNLWPWFSLKGPPLQRRCARWQGQAKNPRVQALGFCGFLAGFGVFDVRDLQHGFAARALTSELRRQEMLAAQITPLLSC